MARVLITGMSGAGKSTVLGALAARGYRTVDTDYDGWTDGDGGPWDVDRMAALLAAQSTVVVSGTSENQGLFSDRFEHVVLLSAPAEVLIERVRARANNPYGHTAAQQQEILANVAAVEPLLRQGATLELDGRLPPGELADVVARLAGPRDADLRLSRGTDLSVTRRGPEGRPAPSAKTRYPDRSGG